MIATLQRRVPLAQAWIVSQPYKISICSLSNKCLATFSNICQYLVILGKKNSAECPSPEPGQYLKPTKYLFAHCRTNIWQHLAIFGNIWYYLAKHFAQSANHMSLASISILQNIYLLTVNQIFGPGTFFNICQSNIFTNILRRVSIRYLRRVPLAGASIRYLVISYLSIIYMAIFDNQLFAHHIFVNIWQWDIGQKKLGRYFVVSAPCCLASISTLQNIYLLTVNQIVGNSCQSDIWSSHIWQ